MSTLASVILEGTDASKPAAGIPGRLFFTTDTGKVYYDTGSAWLQVGPSGSGGGSPLTTKGDLLGFDTAPDRLSVGADGDVLTADSTQPLGVKWAAGGGGAVSSLTTTGTSGAATLSDGVLNIPVYSGGGGGGGALTQIAKQVLSAAASSVTFSSIPSTYANLVLKGTARGDSGSQGAALRIQYNGDATSDHCYNFSLFLQGDSTNHSGANYLSDAFLTNIPTGSDNSGSAGIFRLDIPGYANTVFNKQGMVQSWGVIGDQSNRIALIASGHEWQNTAAINQIALYLPDGVNFVAGSIFTLYGEQ